MTSKFKADGCAEKIEPSNYKFINHLKQLDKNPREFLFETVFELFGMKEFTVNVVPMIREVKHEYDSAVNNLVRELGDSIREMFATGKGRGSLPSVLKDWYESLSEEAKQYLYSGNENKILDLMATVTNDEGLFVQRLAKTVTFLRIDDWNNDTADIFLRDLRAFKTTIERFSSRRDVDVASAASYELVFTDANGERILKRFDRAEYSERAKLLRSEINTALEEMGQAISEQEKRQVLIEILERLC